MPTYTGSAYTTETYVGESPDPDLSITPLPVESAQDVPGPGWGDALTPLSVDSAQVVNAPVWPPPPALLNPITPASVDSAQSVPGPIIGAILDPEVPTDPTGRSNIELIVVDHPDALSYSCQPRLNDTGTAEVVVKRNLDPAALPLDSIVGFNLLGQRIFTGRVTARTDNVLDQGEEANETITASIEGMLSEWDNAIVYPDFGASYPVGLGPPTQDTRIFDWTMSGIGGDSAEGVAGVNIVNASAMTNRYGQSDEVFPLPDVWPAPRAKWMWATDPSNLHQPQGWCHFREPLRTEPGRLQVWCCVYDYAEVWFDGVPLLTCDQPGVAQHVEIETNGGLHLITIRAWNGGGKAGVLAAVMPVDDQTGLYRTAVRLSDGGWNTLAYPTRTFRLNPAQVLRRLRREAQTRGVRGWENWVFQFNETYDSAGRPWPDGEPIALEIGMSYLDVLKRLAEDRVDFAAAPAGRKLRMWVKGRGTSVDHSPDPWSPDQYDSMNEERSTR